MNQGTGSRFKLRAGALALALLLSACASGPQQTAQIDPKNGDGIGGTGIKVADTRAGDGVGGTGILGTISGFGSIIVNGLKLEYGRDTRVEIDGRPASLEDLKVGQVILGKAARRDGQLYLDKLEMLHAVSGPIDAIDHAAQTMTVLGQNVRLNIAGDAAAIDSFKTLTKGDQVSVSGLRQADGTVVASRIDQRPDDGRLVVRGIAQNVGAGTFRVGGLTVALDMQSTVSPVAEGGRVFVSGRVINGTFTPDVIIGAPALPFDKGVTDVSLEAYAPAATGGTVMIEGVAVDGAALPAGTASGDRIIVTGRVSGADRITASNINKIRTVITILRARGSLRPAAVRPASNRPERMQRPTTQQRPETPERPSVPERPDSVRPERPPIERPDGIPMV